MSNFALLQAPMARPGDPLMPKSSVRADGTDYRFALTYLWDADAPILPWIMLNPAYAGTRSAFDLTARRVIRFSWRWGFGGALLLNIAPVIAPNTADLRDWLNWADCQDWEARDQLWCNWHILQEELAAHLAIECYPDMAGGSHDMTAELNRARDAAVKERVP